MPILATAQARTYYPELDGVRALAALMIIVFHLSQMGVPIPGPTLIGQTGVDLFFVLSGFLITSILLKARIHDWQEVRTFFIRRSLRIFPLYFGYLAVAAALGAAFTPWSWVYLQNIAFAFGHPMGDLGHFWSLAVEEQFYLVWPFLVLFLPRRLLLPSLWGMIVLALVARAALVPTHIDVFYLTLTRLDGLAGGALLAVYLSLGRLRTLRRFLVIAGSISTLLLLWELARFHGQGVPFVQITRYTLLSCAYTAAIGLLVTGSPASATRWLASTPMRFIGRISYGLYVFHPAALKLCFDHLPGWPLGARVLAGLLATSALTLLSWFCWERPFLLLKDRLAPDLRPGLRPDLSPASL